MSMQDDRLKKSRIGGDIAYIRVNVTYWANQVKEKRNCKGGCKVNELSESFEEICKTMQKGNKKMRTEK